MATSKTSDGLLLSESITRELELVESACACLWQACAAVQYGMGGMAGMTGMGGAGEAADAAERLAIRWSMRRQTKDTSPGLWSNAQCPQLSHQYLLVMGEGPWVPGSAAEELIRSRAGATRICRG